KCRRGFAPSFLRVIPLAGEGRPRSGSRAEIRLPAPLIWRWPGGQDSAAPYECADVARDTNPKPNSDRVRTLPALPVSSDQDFASNHPCPEKSGSRFPRKRPKRSHTIRIWFGIGIASDVSAFVRR